MIKEKTYDILRAIAINKKSTLEDVEKRIGYPIFIPVIKRLYKRKFIDWEYMGYGTRIYLITQKGIQAIHHFETHY